MHTRTLTINFQRSITAGVPNTMEVAIAPLNDPGAPSSNALLVGGTQVKTITLSNAVNTVTFDLVPTDLPELTSRVTYRAAWRERYMGRQYTQDFVMPDFNVVFSDLEELGNIIGGDVYLQWSDRGRANGVAGLDSDGHVIDGAGNPVTGGGSNVGFQAAIDDEVVARIQGDQDQMDFYLQHIQDSTTGLLATVNNTLNTALATVNSNLGDEVGLRQQAVDSLNYTLTGLQTSVSNTLTQIATKADLVGGKVPVGQLPSVMFGKAVGVANESAMLALTGAQINQGDFAVRPDGIYFLNGANPAILANWVLFRDNNAVASINGHTGAVTLSASDVGARPAGGQISQGDITGLAAALNAKASSVVVNDVSNRVTALETLGLGGGSGQLDTTAKTSWWTSSAVTTNMSQVSLRSPFGFNGVSYYYDPAGAVAGEAVYPYLTPNGHLKFVARNESNPVDPVYATQTAMNNLTATVNGKASQSSVDTLTTAVSGKAEQSDLSALTTLVNTKASTASVTTINSTLSNKANQSDLVTLTTTVGTKADQSTVTALTTTVSGKASQAALDALTTTVGTKATQASVTALTTTVGTKADQSALTTLTGRVTTVETGKADLDVTGKIVASQLPNMALTNVVPVSSKAEMLALTTLQVQPGDVALVNDNTVDRGSYVLTGLDPSLSSSWTRLVTPTAGVVTVNSINPISGNITLAAADVGARATGVNILQSEVTGLTAALAAKVDTSTYTTALAGKIALSDAQALLSAATPLKWRADLADTTSTAVPSGTGITTDGVTVSSGNVILLTNQTPSTNNGLYVAGSGTWNRANDMATGSYFLKGSAVMVLGGSSNTGTIFQQSQAAGVVGTNANSWSKVFTAGSGSTNSLTASSGIQKVTVNNSGVISYDFQLDTSVAARKWSGYVTPQSGNSAIVTHNLGTQNVIAWFRDASSKDSVLVGWKPTDNNNLSVEFDSPIGSTQYFCTVVG